jgi:hypothetical protein
MSDFHDKNDTQIDLEGYASCKNDWCKAFVIKEVAEKTRGYCSTCWRTVFNANLTEIEVRAVAERVKMPLRSKNQAKRNKGNKTKAKAVEKAKLRAMKRLRALFPDLYNIFLADERARAGLDPWPTEMAVRADVDVDGSKTLAFAEVYHHLQQAGVDFDAPSIKSTDVQ